MQLLLFALNRRSARGTSDRQVIFGVVLGILGVALLSTQALSGHAAAVSPNAPLAVLVDTLHLTAASFWIGGLLALAVGMLPMALAGRGTPAFAALAYAGWGSFGGLAAFSVGILIATGLYSTGRQVASVDALITTFYGRTLIVKIALVLLVGAFGLINSSLLHPWLSFPLARLLRRPPGWTPLSLTQLPTLVIAEIAFGLLIFLVTGTLDFLTAARGPEFAAATASSQVVSQRADDLLITFQAAPNQPGQNIAHHQGCKFTATCPSRDHARHRPFYILGTGYRHDFG